MTRPPSKTARSKTEAFLCSPECAYKARGLGLVGREVTLPYNIPEETRQKLSALRTQQNAVRKAEGRYAHTEETKAKLSKTTAKAIAEGRIPRVSKMEGKVAPVLDQLQVTYIPQHKMRGADGRFAAVVDYFLPDLNLALEFNGTFWHADPRKYPDGPVHPSQLRTAEKYTRKVDFLAEKGIPVVEVWEIDFENDPEGAVRAALGM